MTRYAFTNVRIFDGTGEDPYLGDVLVEANGQTLHRPTDLLDALSRVKAGASFSARVVRGGTLESIVITPGERHAEGANE